MHLNHSILLENRNRMQRRWVGMREDALAQLNVLTRMLKVQESSLRASQHIYIEVPLRKSHWALCVGDRRACRTTDRRRARVYCTRSRHVSSSFEFQQSSPSASDASVGFALGVCRCDGRCPEMTRDRFEADRRVR
jgi:hypothetical protein